MPAEATHQQPSPMNLPDPGPGQAKLCAPWSLCPPAGWDLVTMSWAQGLMLNFIKTLPEMGSSLWMLVFVNSGVKLAVKDSPVLETLQKLEENQVKVLVCGTCLEFFGLTDSREAGQTTNMLDIITAMSHADKIVTI